jgi:hypothetical protein
MNSHMFSRARFARSISRFILLGVLLPNIAYLGHWGVAESADAPAAGHAEKVPSEEHALHCHAGPSKCAGPQAITGSIWVGQDSGLVTPDGAIRPFLEAPSVTAIEPPAARLLEPPRAA